MNTLTRTVLALAVLAAVAPAYAESKPELKPKPTNLPAAQKTAPDNKALGATDTKRALPAAGNAPAVAPGANDNKFDKPMGAGTKPGFDHKAGGGPDKQLGGLDKKTGPMDDKLGGLDKQGFGAMPKPGDMNENFGKPGDGKGTFGLDKPDTGGKSGGFGLDKPGDRGNKPGDGLGAGFSKPGNDNKGGFGLDKPNNDNKSGGGFAVGGKPGDNKNTGGGFMPKGIEPKGGDKPANAGGKPAGNDKPQEKPQDKPSDKPADKPDEKPGDKPADDKPDGDKPAGEKEGDKPDKNTGITPTDEERGSGTPTTIQRDGGRQINPAGDAHQGARPGIGRQLQNGIVVNPNDNVGGGAHRMPEPGSGALVNPGR